MESQVFARGLENVVFVDSLPRHRLPAEFSILDQHGRHIVEQPVGDLRLVLDEAEHGVGSKPSLFGHEFDPNPGTRFGLPPFYALHAWVWKPNPTPLTGIFSAWNPRVTC